MVKFGYTIIYVSSVNDALSFFEKAFKMNRKFVTEENDYGELDTGETTLAFATHALGSSNLPAVISAVLRRHQTSETSRLHGSWEL